MTDRRDAAQALAGHRDGLGRSKARRALGADHQELAVE